MLTWDLSLGNVLSPIVADCWVLLHPEHSSTGVVGHLGSYSSIEISSELCVCGFGVMDKPDGNSFHVENLVHKELWNFV